MPSACRTPGHAARTRMLSSATPTSGSSPSPTAWADMPAARWRRGSRSKRRRPSCAGRRTPASSPGRAASTDPSPTTAIVSAPRSSWPTAASSARRRAATTTPAWAPRSWRRSWRRPARGRTRRRQPPLPVRDGAIHQLTRDDSWAATLLEQTPARCRRRRSPATRCGTCSPTRSAPANRPTSTSPSTALVGGETLLLCSDGLHTVLHPRTAYALLRQAATSRPPRPASFAPRSTAAPATT